MGLLSGLLGKASEKDASEVEQELQHVLIEGEHIDKAYQLVRDLVIFTDRRLILIDRQGIMGRKTEYHSIPYRSITHFSVESAGTFDLDCDLKVWVSGREEPFEQAFKSASSADLQKTLAAKVLRN